MAALGSDTGKCYVQNVESYSQHVEMLTTMLRSTSDPCSGPGL